jgi:mono/diheme cytochrome c family protein
MALKAGGAVRRGWAVLIAIVAAGLALLMWLHGPQAMDFAGGQPVNLADYRGTDPTGAAATLQGADPVKRGEYLARASDCMVCHTVRGGAPYAGGFAFNLPFGTLYSTNITPDKDTGIGGYSDAQFLAALHRGVRADGARMYPAMPYTAYTYMSDADALAIKAYLFSLAPVHAPARAASLAFPFNQRWLLGIWAGLYNPDQRFQPNAARSAEWNRGAYISEALAHCGECHTPRNVAFALNNRRKFAGAVAAGWSAYNITPDPTSGVGGWHEAVFPYLSQGHADGHGTASGPMGEAVDHSLSRLAPEDVRAVVTYLASVPPVKSPDLPALLTTPADASPRVGSAGLDGRGKQVFEGACVSCHDWSGVSALTPFATLTGARAVNDQSGRNIAQVVIGGISRETLDGLVSMPAFGDSYSDEEIAAVANYVSARFGSKGSSLDARDVAGFRREVAP